MRGDSLRDLDRRLGRIEGDNFERIVRDYSPDPVTDVIPVTPPADEQVFLPYRKTPCLNRANKEAKAGEARYVVGGVPLAANLFNRLSGRYYCRPPSASVEVVQSVYASTGPDPVSSDNDLTQIVLAEAPAADDLVIVMAPHMNTPSTVADWGPSDRFFITSATSVWRFMAEEFPPEEINTDNGTSWRAYSSWASSQPIYTWGDQLNTATISFTGGSTGAQNHAVLALVVRGVKRNADDSPGVLKYLRYGECEPGASSGTYGTKPANLRNRIFAGHMPAEEVTPLSPSPTLPAIAAPPPGSLAITITSHANDFKPLNGATNQYRHDFYDPSQFTLAEGQAVVGNYTNRSPNNRPTQPGHTLDACVVSERIDDGRTTFEAIIPTEWGTNGSGPGDNSLDTAQAMLFEPGEATPFVATDITPVQPQKLVVDLLPLVEPVRGVGDRRGAAVRYQAARQRQPVIALEDVPARAEGFFATAGYAVAAVYLRDRSDRYAAPLPAPSVERRVLSPADAHVTEYHRACSRNSKNDAGYQRFVGRSEFLYSTHRESPVRIARLFREIPYWLFNPAAPAELLSVAFTVASGVGAITGVTSSRGTPTPSIASDALSVTGSIAELWPRFDTPPFLPQSAAGDNAYGAWVLDDLGDWTYTLDAAAVASLADGLYFDTRTFAAQHSATGSLVHADPAPTADQLFGATPCFHPFVYLGGGAGAPIEPWVEAMQTDADDYRPQPALASDDAAYLDHDHRFDPYLGRLPGSVEADQPADLMLGLQWALVLISERDSASRDCC